MHIEALSRSHKSNTTFENTSNVRETANKENFHILAKLFLSNFRRRRAHFHHVGKQKYTASKVRKSAVVHEGAADYSSESSLIIHRKKVSRQWATARPIYFLKSVKITVRVWLLFFSPSTKYLWKSLYRIAVYLTDLWSKRHSQQHEMRGEAWRELEKVSRIFLNIFLNFFSFVVIVIFQLFSHHHALCLYESTRELWFALRSMRAHWARSRQTK